SINAKVLLSKIPSPLKFQVPPDACLATVVPARGAYRDAVNFDMNVGQARRRAESRAVKFFLLAGFCCATAKSRKISRRPHGIPNRQELNFALC
ncbi:MAG TPA: hypothetical protein VIQ24_22115, partial [Pyrinomonadaceae bacterium]